MRKLLLLLLIAGIGLGIGYPWYIYNFSGAEIGSWRVFDRPGPYKPITVALKDSDGPVRVFVDMQPLRNFIPAEGRSALTSVVTRNGKDVLVKTLTYVNAQAANRGSPQGPRVYRDRAGDIDPVGSGDYTFKIGPGDVDGLEVAQVDLVLRKGAATVDRWVIPAGLTMIAVALFGLIRLGRRKAQPTSTPAAPKWGR